MPEIYELLSPQVAGVGGVSALPVADIEPFINAAEQYYKKLTVSGYIKRLSTFLITVF